MADRISYGPITLFESDAYKRAKQLEATKKEIDLENAQLELQSKKQRMAKEEGETLSGRVGQADIAADVLERARQKRLGVEIGAEIGKEATAANGLSLLEATAKQAGINREMARESARLGAVEQYMVDKGLAPTAKIDVGGMTSTVPFGSGGERMASAYSQIYQNMVPQLAQTYIAEGYDRDTAIRMASDSVRNQLVKAGTGGKVVLAGADGVSTISYSNEQAQRMWKDPKTPKHLRDQLNGFFGTQEGPTASDWVKNQTRR
ncbi:MAG: hypothetical protein EBR82_61505 [Caulobacteraceae bacterium]|nr:hypothetical protein [Caulobacteraceae bacterium]